MLAYDRLKSMRDELYTPFEGKRAARSEPIRVLHRFAKAGGHYAEIRERKVTEFRALEFLVFVDGSLLESQMFHSVREIEYPAELAKRVSQFTEGGWLHVERNPSGDRLV